MLPHRFTGKRLPLVALTLAASLALAGPAPAQAPEASARGWLDSFNDAMHGFNRWTAQSWRALTGGDASPPASPAPVPAATPVLASMLLNLVNEPVTALSWSLVGDGEKAGASIRRFWTNTTRGWLGAYDVAAREGNPADHIDIGLALCALGVGEGGYIVLPFIGARTGRDGLADFIFTNAVTFAALAPFIGFPPSPSAFLSVEILEEAIRIPAIRQIDSSEESQLSAEAVRENYLAERRRRCDAVRTRIEPNVQPR